MAENVGPLNGIVEIDESFLGGKKELNRIKDRRGIGHKMIVFGMIQRDGNLILRHVVHKDRTTLLSHIRENIAPGSTIYSDKYAVYSDLGSMGYQHKVIEKKDSKKFRRGVNTNSIENVWLNLKLFLKAHRSVSPKHLQSYLDEFCFKYNRRHDDKKCLEDLLERLIMPCVSSDMPPVSSSQDQPEAQAYLINP